MNPFRLALMGTLLTLLAAACGTLEVGVEPPPTTQGGVSPTRTAPPAPTQVPATDVPSPVANPTLPAGSDAFPTAGAPTPLPAGSFACSLAYASRSLLYCLGPNSGTPILIADHSADGTVSQPVISSDGAWVAYLVNRITGESELWAVNVSPLAGTDGLALPREILADPSGLRSDIADNINSPMRPQWQPGTHTVFFTTRFNSTTTDLGPGERPNGDLWRVNADNTGPFNLLPQKGLVEFTLSPDGQHLAMAMAESIVVADPDLAHLYEVITFAPINTASEFAYRPALVWSPDSSFFSVALPSSDPFAADVNLTVYRVHLDGTRETRFTRPGNFIWAMQIPPAVSPDGRYLVYADITSTDTQRGDVHLIDMNTQEDHVVANGLWQGLGWAADSRRYAYAATPTGYGTVVQTNAAVEPFGMPDAQLTQLAWIDGTSFYFMGVINGQGGIYLQRPGADPQPIALGLMNYASLAFRP